MALCWRQRYTPFLRVLWSAGLHQAVAPVMVFGHSEPSTHLGRVSAASSRVPWSRSIPGVIQSLPLGSRDFSRSWSTGICVFRTPCTLSVLIRPLFRGVKLPHLCPCFASTSFGISCHPCKSFQRWATWKLRSSSRAHPVWQPQCWVKSLLGQINRCWSL